MSAATAATSQPAKRPGLVLLALGVVLFVLITAVMHVRRPVLLDDPARTELAQWPEVRIDPNTADVAELRLLPGIGPRLAERIIDDREAHGPFTSLEDLRRVRGIGPVTLERIAPLLVVHD